MTIPRSKLDAFARKSIFVAGFALVSFVFAVPAMDARAQQTPYYDLNTPEVTVDLSVLNDGGMGPPRTGAMSPSVGGGGLKMPGGTPPKSRLLVAPPRKPSPAPKPRAKKPKPEKPMKTRKSSSPSKVASAPPPPSPPKKKEKKAPAKKKETSEPKPSQTASAETTSSDGPPPPPSIASPSGAGKAPPPPPAPATPKSLEPSESASSEKSEESGKQQASAAPATAPASAQPKGSGNEMAVVFPEASAKISSAMKKELEAFADKLKKNETLRLQLKAYAGGKDVSPSKARRLSLSRALAVRSQLISEGVRSTRIDVRALGDKTTEQPMNRVDVVIVER